MAAHFNRVDIKVKKDKVKKLLIVLSYSTFQIYSPSINFKVFAWEVTEERPSHEIRVSGGKDLEIMPSPGVTNTTSPPGIIKTRGGRNGWNVPGFDFLAWLSILKLPPLFKSCCHSEYKTTPGKAGIAQ